MTNMKKAFTLIELLIVVAIVGILAGVGIPMYNGYMLEAKINATDAKHKIITDFISSNLVLCSTSVNSIKLQEYYGQQSVSCSDTPWNLAIAFAKHFKYTDMKNPYGEGSGSPVYASTDACLWPGDTTIWGSSNSNQGKFIRVTTRVKGEPNCTSPGTEQIYIPIE
tara:strand:- start:11 stop:508 length:498 start_codon:yes stop_codon:yes gene_type:complete